MAIIYKVPGTLKGPKGTTYDWKGVDDDAKVPDGWCATLAEALETTVKPKRTRRTKAEMEASKAEES